MIRMTLVIHPTPDQSCGQSNRENDLLCPQSVLLEPHSHERIMEQMVGRLRWHPLWRVNMGERRKRGPKESLTITSWFCSWFRQYQNRGSITEISLSGWSNSKKNFSVIAYKLCGFGWFSFFFWLRFFNCNIIITIMQGYIVFLKLLL